MHPDNLNRALSAVLAWSEPVKATAAGRGTAWQGIAREGRDADALRAVIAGGEKVAAISPHDLRHTYATLALRHGVPLEVVSKNLGHGTPAITLTVYRHVLDDELRATVVDLFPTPASVPVVLATPTALLN